MAKIQIIIFVVLGSMTYDNFNNPNILTVGRPGMQSEYTDVSAQCSVLIDSPHIVVKVGNIIKDTASTNEIIANRGLKMVLKGFPKEFQARMVSFNITTINRHNEILTKNLETQRNLFSKDQIVEFKKLGGSGKIIFDDIKVVGGSGMVRHLPPFSLTVHG